MLESETKFKPREYGSLKLVEDFKDQGVKIYKWKVPELMHHVLLKVTDNEGGCSLEVNLRVFEYKMAARILIMFVFLIYGISFFFTGGFQAHNLIWFSIMGVVLYNSQIKGASMLQQLYKGKLLEILDSSDKLS